jgi:hypothetical protein
MRGYDQWLTTNVWEEQQMAEAEEIINNGMRYFELDRTWTRVNGRVRWSCEFCGGLPECKANCWWTLDPE